MDFPNIETRRQQECAIKYLSQYSTVVAISVSKSQTLTKTKLDLLKDIVVPIIN